MTLNHAFIDYASRMRENLLVNIYTVGKHSIERGSADSWTPNYRRIQKVGDEMGGGEEGVAAAVVVVGAAARTPKRDAEAWAELHTPELHDPRGHVIPSSQPTSRPR